MNLSRKHLLTAAVVAVAALLVLLKYWDYILNPWTRDGQVRAEVIQITPRVSGPLVALPVVDNQFVKAGDLLFEIDPRTYAASLAQAQAEYDKAKDNYQAQGKNVESAQAQVEASKAQILQAQSGIKQMDATVAKNMAELGRQQQLLPQKATSKKSVERAQANYDVSVEQRAGRPGHPVPVAGEPRPGRGRPGRVTRHPGRIRRCQCQPAPGPGRIGPGYPGPGIHPSTGASGRLRHQPQPAPG